MNSLIFYHGTSSLNYEKIKKEGFVSPSYFTTSIEDAEYYAATGGEWDLQDREEAYESKTGIIPREEYEFWEMCEKLYPKGAYPVVLEIEVSESILAKSKSDTGADGGIVFDIVIAPSLIKNVIKVNWPD